MLGGFHLIDMVSHAIFLYSSYRTLVSKFAWGPVMNMMQKREEYVASEIEAAEKKSCGSRKSIERSC